MQKLAFPVHESIIVRVPYVTQMTQRLLIIYKFTLILSSYWSSLSVSVNVTFYSHVFTARKQKRTDSSQILLKHLIFQLFTLTTAPAFVNFSSQVPVSLTFSCMRVLSTVRRKPRLHGVDYGTYSTWSAHYRRP